MKKKSIWGAFALMLSVIMIFGVSTTAFAANPETEISNETASDEYGIAPASYIGPTNITVSNGSTFSRFLDNRYCAYEYVVSGSSSVRIETYIDGALIRNDTVSHSGKIDWIDMKSVGNHSVVLKFYTNSTVNIQLTLYSWQ